MSFFFPFFQSIFGFNNNASDRADLIFGSNRRDNIDGQGGDDFIFGLGGRDTLDGGEGDDTMFGGRGRDTLNGGNGEDALFGGRGADRIVGNKGDDKMFGGFGRDTLVWNNGDGSDLMDGGRGRDKVQVNFNTDLVNDDLQNKDTAAFSVTEDGVQFARVELNDQAVNGLFQLDIRNTETLETNFGGGEDTAQIIDDVLSQIVLDLDGGGGVDLLDFSQSAEGVDVDLAAGTAGTASVQNFENVTGSEFDDVITGDDQDNIINGLGGVDSLYGGAGDDILVANKGNDFIFGEDGDDLLVWNNGDGSDLMDGGAGDDRVQVNFNTDLVNDDLQNKDTAAFSVTEDGVQFARVELNDQAVNGLFQLDIRNTETLETNFGGGEDTAQIIDDVLSQIVLDLDGGAGVDLLDFSQSAEGVDVDLAAGTAGTASVQNFENVTGSDFDDTIRGDDGANVIRGGAGNDTLFGGAGADTFLFFEDDSGIDVIADFSFGEDSLVFVTSSGATAQDFVGQLVQNGDDVELATDDRLITFEDALVSNFNEGDFLFA